MNRYQFRDLLFGRDKELLASIKRLLDENIVNKGAGRNPFIWFEDMAVSKDESDFTVDQLYDYFRQFLIMKLNRVSLLPSCWANGVSDNLYSVKTGPDVDKLITKLKGVWAELASEYVHLKTIESFFNSHDFIPLEMWPLCGFQITPKDNDVCKTSVDIKWFLELLYSSDCEMSVNDQKVYVIYGLTGRILSPHSVDVHIPKGLEAFRYTAIPLIEQAFANK